MKLASPTILLVALVLLLGESSPAQNTPRTTSEPAELSARREEFLREMQKVSVPVLTNYLHVIESLQEQATRRSDLHAAQSFEAEAKTIRAQLTAAVATSKGALGAVVLPVKITSAIWQGPEPKQSADVTDYLQKMMESGTASITINTAEAAGGADPARGKPKSLILEYSVNGKVRRKTFPEGQKLNFSDLK